MRIARIGGTLAFGCANRQGWVSREILGLRGGVDLASIVPRLNDVARLLSDAEPDIDDNVAVDAPMYRPGKILAVGLNYERHIAEVGKPRPKYPMIFAKYPSAITGPDDPIILNPEVTSEVDYEVELAVVIGTPARNVDAAHALEHVLGYCVANDVSARDLQRSETQISRSKSLDTFCPIGPWITTVDEVPDPQNLAIQTTVNDEVRQSSTTGDMLFDVATLIAYLSRTATLEVGDLLLTGTPSGVGSGMTPPTYLREGDVVCCEISGLGRLRNRVSDAEPRGSRQMGNAH